MPKGWACIALASEAGVNIYGGTRPVICNVHLKFAAQMEWVEFHTCGSSETGSRDATQLIEATPGTWLDNIFKLQPGAFCVGCAGACLAELFLGHRMLTKGFDCFHTEASHPPLCTTGLPSERPRDRRGLACCLCMFLALSWRSRQATAIHCTQTVAVLSRQTVACSAALCSALCLQCAANGALHKCCQG